VRREREVVRRREREVVRRRMERGSEEVDGEE
jgi:hypothetical protein